MTYDEQELISLIKRFEGRLPQWQLDTSVEYITSHNESTIGFECFIDYLVDAEISIDPGEYEKLLAIGALLGAERRNSFIFLKCQVKDQ